MSAQQHPWERRLLAWAAEGLEYDPPVQGPMRDARHLDRAYVYCDKIAREQGRTFYKASGLLPDEKRRAVRALYAFCRITDDISTVRGTIRKRRWRPGSSALLLHRRHRTTQWCWRGPTLGRATVSRRHTPSS